MREFFFYTYILFKFKEKCQQFLFIVFNYFCYISAGAETTGEAGGVR